MFIRCHGHNVSQRGIPSLLNEDRPQAFAFAVQHADVLVVTVSNIDVVCIDAGHGIKSLMFRGLFYPSKQPTRPEYLDATTTSHPQISVWCTCHRYGVAMLGLPKQLWHSSTESNASTHSILGNHPSDIQGQHLQRVCDLHANGPEAASEIT
jgi:hypothetical protein